MQKDAKFLRRFGAITMKPSAETVALLERPSRVHSMHKWMAECGIRSAVDVFGCSFELAAESQSKDEIAFRVIRFCGEVYHKHPMFACAVVEVIGRSVNIIPSLVRAARACRNEVAVGAFLAYLRAHLLTGAPSKGKALILESTRLGALWLGLSPEETAERLEEIERNYRWTN